MTRKKAVVMVLAVALAAILAVPYSLAAQRDRDARPPNPNPGPADMLEQIKPMFELLERMSEACFDEVTAAMIAIGGLKDDVRRKPAQITKDLETQLKSTKTLGLRNAIRMTLKDIYKAQGEDERVLGHLRAMLAENDRALQDRAAEEEDDDNDDDDE